MIKKLRFILLTWLATFLMMALQKPLFLVWYADKAAACSLAEWFEVIWHGALLDSTMAGYITALPALFTFVTLWTGISDRLAQRILKCYFITMAVVAALLVAVDLGLYGYWGFRLDSTLLIYLSDPKGAMASLDLPLFLKQAAIGVAYAALLIWGWLKVAKFFDGSRLPWRKALAYTPLMLLVLGLDFLAIRGSVGPSVANVSQVSFSSNLFLNHAATNPIFSFLSTIGKQADYAAEYPFYEAEELAARFDEIRGNRPASQPIDSLLRTPRPNVAFVILEGFGSTVLEADEAGEAIAPNLQRLKEEGVYFSNLYANSFRTDRGQVSILSGFPAQTRISLMKLSPKCIHLPSIARSMAREGYRTHFTYGGDINFTNQSSYMYATGWEELYWQNGMSFDAPTSKWGYDDRVVGEAFAEEVIRFSEQETPFLAGWLTLSSHEPFEVPFAKFDDKVANAMAFTDDCIGRVIDRLKASPAWENLLVVFVADHGMPSFRKGTWSETEIHRIPMIWVGGAVKSPAVVDAIGSQIDIAATLLAQMGIDHSDFEYSKNMLDPSLPKFGYYTYNEGLVMIDEKGESAWDIPSDRMSEGADPQQIERGKALLQQTYEDIARR